MGVWAYVHGCYLRVSLLSQGVRFCVFPRPALMRLIGASGERWQARINAESGGITIIAKICKTIYAYEHITTTEIYLRVLMIAKLLQLNRGVANGSVWHSYQARTKGKVCPS